jgi:hypothetical protein
MSPSKLHSKKLGSRAFSVLQSTEILPSRSEKVDGRIIFGYSHSRFDPDYQFLERLTWLAVREGFASGKCRQKDVVEHDADLMR